MSQRCYISPTWGEAPPNRFAPIICILVAVPTYAKFGTEIFRGYNFTEGQIFSFPVDSCMGLTTVQR